MEGACSLRHLGGTLLPLPGTAHVAARLSPRAAGVCKVARPAPSHGCWAPKGERVWKRVISPFSNPRHLVAPAGCLIDIEAVVACTPADTSAAARELKEKILRLVAPLDRGVAASNEDARRVEEAVAELEQEGERSRGSTGAEGAARAWETQGIRQLQGVWRLVFSSGFVSGSLGGLRPGPPTGRLPILVGQVLQRIDVAGRELDNIVELRLGLLPWPLSPLQLTATLAHTFQLFGESGVRIIFERTTVALGDYAATSSPSASPLALSTPALPDFLRPSPDLRSGQFSSTYVDGDFRVARGDRGEVRVFVRASS